MVEKLKKQAYNSRLKSNLVTSILEAISLDELAMQRTEVEAIQAPPPQQFYAEKLQCLCIFMLPSSSPPFPFLFLRAISRLLLISVNNAQQSILCAAQG